MTASRGDPAAAQPIGERIDVALDLHAAALVKAYFDPGGPFAGATFDTLGDNEPDHVGADDLLAVTLLDVRVPALVVRRVLDQDQPAIGAAIGAIPDSVDLWDATDEELAPALAAWDRLTAYHGVGPVIAGKLLARKRPRLVPIFDSVVGAVVNAPQGEYWVTLRSCLANNHRHVRLGELRPAGLSPKVSNLRIFDVITWMRFSRGRNARACRQHLGVSDE